MAAVENIDLDHALFDPASMFQRPDAVVEQGSLPLEHKVEILRRWAYDAIEMAVAEEEGMDGEEVVTIDTILTALYHLTARRYAGHAGP